MRMRRIFPRGLPLVGALLLSLAALQGSARAQAAGWEQEWSATIAAAKKEGTVVCGCPLHPGSRQFLMTCWQQEFPDIKLDYTPATLPEWPARLEAERSAGKYLWDVMFSGPGPETYRLAHENVLDPLLPALILPDVKDPNTWGGWESAFYDTERKRMLSFWTQLNMPYYNAKFIPPEKAEKLGLKVLLDPEYKGKIVWWDPRFGGSGSNVAYFLNLKLGQDDLKTVLVDQSPLFLRDANALVERMVRGTAYISLGPNLDEGLVAYKNAGVSYDIRPLGFTADVASISTGYGIAAVINGSPHPNAGKVFINWLLSKPIQDALAKAVTSNSRRVDVPPPFEGAPAPLAGQHYIELQREEYLDDRAKVMQFAKAVRPQ